MVPFILGKFHINNLIYCPFAENKSMFRLLNTLNLNKYRYFNGREFSLKEDKDFRKMDVLFAETVL